MWCTTECWDCEDRTCEHYVDKTKLYFENENNKKEIEKLNKRNKEIYDGFMSTTEELCEITKEVEKLKKIIQIKQNRINKLNKKLIRRDNIIEDLKAILKSKGYETYIPVLERSDKE